MTEKFGRNSLGLIYETNGNIALLVKGKIIYEHSKS